MKTLNGDQFSDLVGRCYQMALQPELLPEFMLTLRDALGASNVTFGRYRYDGATADVNVFCTLSFAEDWRNDVMARDYNDPDKNIGFRLLLHARPGQVACSEEFIALKELKREGFYQDICKPLGIGATAALTLTREPTQGSGLFYQFGPDQLPQRDADIAFTQQIAPHLRRSAQIMEVISSSQANLFSLERLMEEQSTGVALIDDAGEVLFMNTVAQMHARTQDGLLVRRGRLTVRHRGQRAEFERAVSAAVQTGIGKGFNPGVEMLVRRASGSRPLTCIVSPLLADAPLVPIRRPAAMLLIKDPEALVQSEIDAMARAYKLSPRQKAISALLIDGVATDEIAARLEISRNTLKTHIRRLYGKLDCRNQSEFLRLFSRGFG